MITSTELVFIKFSLDASHFIGLMYSEFQMMIDEPIALIEALQRAKEVFFFF